MTGRSRRSQRGDTNLSDVITQQITGHSTMEMTEYYSHITGYDLDKVLEVIGEIL